MTAAFYLPLGLEEGLETAVQRFGPAHDSLELHLPVVGPDDLLRWIQVLRDARAQNLARRPIAGIIRSLDRVSRRFLDPGDAARREAVDSLARAGRFTSPMLERALDDAFQPVTRGGLSRWLSSELGSVDALDRPAPGPGGTLRHAHGPEWMLQIYAGNVPTLPIWPIYSALLLKASLLAKTSAQEPLLGPLLARTIAEVDENLGACLAVVWWKGGSGHLDRTALALAPAVLAFGGDEAMASISRQSQPDAVRVLHGPKVSVSYIERRALTYAALRGLAARAALDISLYDQQGCLSPHAFYVERRGEVTPGKFAEVLATALEARAHELPRGIVAAEEAASVQLFRSQARFEAAGAAGAAGMSSGGGMSPGAGMLARAAWMPGGGAPSRGASRVLESPGATTWTVVLEDRARFEPGPAHRTVRIHIVDGPEEVARALQPSIRYVEAISLEARGPERVRLAAAFTSLGVPRIAPVGQLQRPTPLGTHGGVRRLLPFVTWSSVEGAAIKQAAPSAAAAPRKSKPTSTPKSSASRSSGRGSRRKAPKRRR
ncbi:MAG TPA: acyl-CoA reductase [Candidatus Dormibacteraeota bacterium]|nr:acyl-CoA reductase [Candidatus Dormibacteraeota bacterium]